MLHRPVLLLISLPLFLAACGGGPAPVPTLAPSASTATLNGVRIIDDRTYQLGVSALDPAQAIVRTGTISQPHVSELSAGAATVQVCGQIQAQDVLTTAIALDSTGSMTRTDPDELRQQAAQAFIDRMTSSDRAAVLSFDDSTSPSAGLQVAYRWQDFTSDKALLSAAVSHATFAGGGTPLYDAIGDANTLLAGTNGTNKSMLVLTDGGDNASSSTSADVIAAARKSGARVYAVGLDSTGTLDFKALEQIASQTRGLFQKATDATQLKAYFDHVYNAVNAQGCLQLNFSVRPPVGSVVSGKVIFTVSVSGKADTALTLPFTVTVR